MPKELYIRFESVPLSVKAELERVARRTGVSLKAAAAALIPNTKEGVAEQLSAAMEKLSPPGAQLTYVGVFIPAEKRRWISEVARAFPVKIFVGAAAGALLRFHTGKMEAAIVAAITDSHG